MFRSFTPQLVSFFKARGGEAVAEDLAQEVASSQPSGGTPGFEFHRWMTFLEAPEREALTLRFIGDLEYHEIAVQTIPVGTAQWRVFNARKKLRPRLRRINPLVATRAA